ncbi:hypothetical protein [Acinetobacter baumannii]|uniref:hypothetical protein n=1 Tax=Acinetobacter baumannii TaxID=470 RepID=UPI0003DF9717|nr:hypothetical protein [Acinetobacter baumannii]EHZ6732866.1 hypothetical protein [Acinetobacter baumannii]EKT8703592.1 hypothetical protein [Acinetobacter baumannii]EKV2133924.1 hypothetical protein [Acinetobacter baumannii]ETQ98392.1 hypothetical protein P673_3442 [Acinetobacter baumannii UH6507]MDC4364548.1 hypothetical protein [Acinetobacter baumannii]
MKKFGICKLTGEYGQFIKSHLIPQALTKPEIKGGIMKEIGEGYRAKKATSSWYDSEIVTKNGEDILTEFDTAAIKELRKHKLIWSSWSENELPANLFNKFTDTHGIRRLEEVDHTTLRLFILSLLWRTCVSQRVGFNEINLPEDELSILKEMLIKRDAGQYFFFPITLIQLSTKGKIHNQTPFIDELTVKPIFNEGVEQSYPIIRYYFDGLVVHIRLTKDEESTKNLGNLFIGKDKDLLLTTVTYEESFQNQNMKAIQNRHLFEDINGLLK